MTLSATGRVPGRRGVAMSSALAGLRFALEPAPATRAQYQRALLLLPLAWPRFCRQHDLTSDAHVVLAQLLAMQPGRWIHQANRVSDPRKSPGLAEVLGWGRQRVLRALAKLRAAGLVLARLYTQADELPSGRHPRTNILRYFVHVALIDWAATGKNEPPDGSLGEPSPGSPSPCDKPAPPTPSRTPRRRRPTAASPAATDAASETPPRALDSPSPSISPPAPADSERQIKGKEPDEAQAVANLCAQWDALRLPNAGGTLSSCRPSEQAAVRNRLREVGYAIVERAIVGAGESDWLRRGRARSALAFVFACAATVRRFALQGDAVLGQRAAAEAAAAERSAQEHDDAVIAQLWRRAPWSSRAAPRAFLQAVTRRDFTAAEAFLPPIPPHRPAVLMTAGASLRAKALPLLAADRRGLSPGPDHGAPPSPEPLVPISRDARAAMQRLIAKSKSPLTSSALSRTALGHETSADKASRLQGEFERKAQQARLALARWAAENDPVAAARPPGSSRPEDPKRPRDAPLLDGSPKPND